MKKTKTNITKKDYYFIFPIKLVIGIMIAFGVIYIMPNIVNIITKIYEELL